MKCPNQKSINDFPIDTHQDISDYEATATIPPPKRCKKLEEYNIKAHPDIDKYIKK